MATKQSTDDYPQAEADRRRDAVLKHMLSRPPQPHKPLGVAKKKTRPARTERARKGKSPS